MRAVGLELSLIHVKMAFWPALGSAGSTDMLTKAGLNKTFKGILVDRALSPLAAELLALQVYSFPLSSL